MWAACLQAHLHTDVHRPCICTGEAAAAAAADNGCLHLARQGSTVKRDPRKAKNCGSPPTWLVLSPPSRARLATQRHSGIPGVLPDPRPACHALDRSASKHGKPMSAKNPPTSVMITERRAKIRKACPHQGRLSNIPGARQRCRTLVRAAYVGPKVSLATHRGRQSAQRGRCSRRKIRSS